MISGDDIEAMREDPQPLGKDFYMRDPVFQRLQWEVRAAFEAGYTAAGVGRGVSNMNPQNGKWFDHWLVSKSRAFLVNNGLMTGSEGFK